MEAVSPVVIEDRAIAMESVGEEDIRGAVSDDAYTPRPIQQVIKRAFDIIVASTLIILFSPILILAAIAVKLSSRGPVLYLANRVGWKDSRFSMYKFRSMRQAEPGAMEMQSAGVLLKSSRHPRITFVGSILRKTSIDELPQLFNVLFGQMSIVGPRPLIPALLPGLNARQQELRAMVRPGITGLFQLRDRIHGETAATMIGHDLEYIQRFSLWLDLVILIQTVPAVLSGRGAV